MFRRSQTPAARDARNRSETSDSSFAGDVQSVMRRIMPDLYFINTPASQMQRHLELLRRIETEPISLNLHRIQDSPLTEITICAYDDAEPGLLSKVCGTLAAHRVNIRTAYIFTACSTDLDAALGTSNKPQPPSLQKTGSSEINDGISDDEATISDTGSEPAAANKGAARNIVLDTLIVSEPYARRERALTNGTIARVKNDLMRVLNREVTVNQLLLKAARRPYPPVQNYDITVLEDAGGTSTLIKIRTEASPGILYRMTSALAALNLNISVAQINTENGLTKDVFYVTDRHGNPFPPSESATLAQRLSNQLNDSPV